MRRPPVLHRVIDGDNHRYLGETMSNDNTPNHYDLHGFGMHITYSTSSIAGKPLLSYQAGQESLNFSGDQITVTKTPLGQLVSVVLQVIPDLGQTTLGLLLPAVLLPDNPASLHITAEAIVNRAAGMTIAGPIPVGVVDHYSVHRMFGTAKTVEF